MTLEEKVAQLGSAWLGFEGDSESPKEEGFGPTGDWEVLSHDGLGQLTRVFGTAPIAPDEGVRRLAELQHDLMTKSRLGVPAVAHEECLTGFTTHGATIFPTPLALAATFNTQIVEEMTAAIGQVLRRAGVHQALAPVMDVVRDYRWGRVEETFGEDPYLCGIMGAAYARGLESQGIVATLKHFAGYSASRGGRNHGPVSIGPRELADIILPPFELALRHGGARAVMHSYADLDGLPPGADPELLTGRLRDQWGFEGIVVSDYWSITFLATMHRVAGTPAEAGAIALAAGVDVELPDTRCYGPGLVARVRDGQLSETLVDRAAARVLRQKAQQGLLAADWSPEPPGGDEPLELDPPAHRTLAREIAEQSIVLLANDKAVLPLSAGVRSIAVLGPCAADPFTFLGCYAFPNHLRSRFPDVGLGVDVPSLLDALSSELPHAELSYAIGCPIQAPVREGIPSAVEAAKASELAIVAVGDRAGIFGDGTSGEGNDAEDVNLPGVQAELVDAILATGTPTVLAVVSGRPYALGGLADRAVAVVQAFIPGEEGGTAIAGVISGRVTPSGKLPVQIPARPGGQPGTYLHPPLGGPGLGHSTVDARAIYPFGHGLSYTTFAYSDLALDATTLATDGEVTIECTVTNTGARSGTETVQLYVADPVAEVARPVTQLAGFARVPLEPGRSARVSFDLHSDRLAYTGRSLERIVDAGEITITLGASSEDVRLTATIELVGPVRVAGPDRVMTTPASVTHI
jgi:beta-glucosidase